MAALIMNYDSLQVRLLIDPGSELSFISNHMVTQCNFKRQHSSISVCGIGGTTSTQTMGIVNITLKSNYSRESVNITAHILQKLTSKLPSIVTHQQHWPHLDQLDLADPNFLVPRQIDIIIGADSYGQIIKEDIIKSSADSPIAQLTIFGWIVLGPIPDNSFSASHLYHSAIDTTHQTLEKLLTKFWVQEEVPDVSSNQLTPEEQACEEHFMSTHTRDPTGRYIVRIPLKLSSSVLGDSIGTAQHCLNRLITRFKKDPLFKELCSSFMSEYETLEHMQLVHHSSSADTHSSSLGGDSADRMTLAQDASASGGLRVLPGGSSTQTQHIYYLPHHGVLKADSLTTKLRVVFNGSSPTTSGKSLNDIQHTGPKLQQDLCDVLIWLRQFKYLFATDITKMYRQVHVHPDDWVLQRILWVDDNGCPEAYQLKTVTYGTKSAPFLAIRSLLQLIDDEGSRYPRAVEPLKLGRYVDDIYGGSDQLDELIQIAQEVKDLCMAGGFPLAKWQSNHSQFFTQFAPDSTRKESIQLDDNATKILGLSWHLRLDAFKFKYHQQHSRSKVTKRLILSEVAQLFDPLGWLTPFTIRPKLLIQELWLKKLNWDEPVPTHQATKWNTIKTELLEVDSILVPRWYHTQPSSNIEFHGFSDASQLAMAAVIYVKITDPKGKTHISLISAKSKVAPLKRITIPRLELSAALILAKLARYVQSTLNSNHAPTYLWTDSSVALTWINSHPSRWKEFVRNRVSKIQDLVPSSIWKFVPGRNNPADCVSRGLTISQLSKHELWWKGPSWLLKPQHSWPIREYSCDASNQLEEQPGLLLNVTSTQPEYH